MVIIWHNSYASVVLNSEGERLPHLAVNIADYSSNDSFLDATSDYVRITDDGYYNDRRPDFMCESVRPSSYLVINRERDENANELGECTALFTRFGDKMLIEALKDINRKDIDMYSQTFTPTYFPEYPTLSQIIIGAAVLDMDNVRTITVITDESKITNQDRFMTFCKRKGLDCEMNIDRNLVSEQSILYMHEPNGSNRAYIGRTMNPSSRWNTRDWRDDYEGCDDRECGKEFGLYYKHNSEFYIDAKRGSITNCKTSICYVDSVKAVGLEKELILAIPNNYNKRVG